VEVTRGCDLTLNLLGDNRQAKPLLQRARDCAPDRVNLPRCRLDHLGDACSPGALQHRDDLRLLGSGARGWRFGCGRLGSTLANGSHSFHHNRLHADRQKPRVGDDERGAVTIAGLAPERLGLAQVAYDCSGVYVETDF